VEQGLLEGIECNAAASEVSISLRDFAAAPLEQFCATWDIKPQEWRDYKVHWWRTHGIKWGGVNMQVGGVNILDGTPGMWLA
jgi:hypothetical protein